MNIQALSTATEKFAAPAGGAKNILAAQDGVVRLEAQLDAATVTAVGALLALEPWKASTAYEAGARVVGPRGILEALNNGTSGTELPAGTAAPILDGGVGGVFWQLEETEVTFACAAARPGVFNHASAVTVRASRGSYVDLAFSDVGLYALDDAERAAFAAELAA